MSKKRKKKIIITESFNPLVLKERDVQNMIEVLGRLRKVLDKLIEDMELRNKLNCIDDLYSLTIREAKGDNARNIRLVGTVLEELNGEEKEKKVSLITINTKTKIDKLSLENRVQELQYFKCTFYAYRNLIASLESMRCSEDIDLSMFRT